MIDQPKAYTTLIGEGVTGYQRARSKMDWLEQIWYMNNKFNLSLFMATHGA